ncbi:MAG TPA: branched-chain amino acid ABC transporter permease [Micromonosporaceae bacterium]|nr:branched-chain amino acid ABC transporter permease [Micromonosporaceae bacterium]
MLPHLRSGPGDRTGPPNRGSWVEEVSTGVPEWQNFQPFIVSGLALGGVYSLSGVGMVVLYRTTGVLNLAFGAVGAMGAFIAWSLVNTYGWPEALAYLVCVGFGAVISLVYGILAGPPLAGRDPLVKAAATIGLALILLGAMSWIWSDKARSLVLPTTTWRYSVGEVFINWTQIIALALGVLVTLATAAFLRRTGLGTAMRALANDREITAALGVPVRRVEAITWLVSGALAGAAGLLLSNLVGLDAATLTFLVISSLAAALIARLRSLVVTLLAGIVIGLVNAMVTPIFSISSYRDMTPFVLAAVALLFLSRHQQISFARRNR